MLDSREFDQGTLHIGLRQSKELMKGRECISYELDHRLDSEGNLYISWWHSQRNVDGSIQYMLLHWKIELVQDIDIRRQLR
jgi:hypothetical protein